MALWLLRTMSLQHGVRHRAMVFEGSTVGDDPMKIDFVASAGSNNT